jgi:hypothetical protein
MLQDGQIERQLFDACRIDTGLLRGVSGRSWTDGETSSLGSVLTVLCIADVMYLSRVCRSGTTADLV